MVSSLLGQLWIPSSLKYVRFGRDLLRKGGEILLRFVRAGLLFDAGTSGRTCLCTRLVENLGKIALRWPTGAASLGMLHKVQRSSSWKRSIARQLENRLVYNISLRRFEGKVEQSVA